ncbi:cation:dicarboxylate symporter family transporter [Shewanella sp. 10N.286.48.A6]|uniref:cation:dicarboxylate symporter family transporter n=1 Tax=Shewanella sp. 10N.286.48.A6 TaxID=1880833 RepID=UPI000C842A5F|nr:cation:dicarboxylase symporter family transporter [Shewanella sp. 10N.286.48.A6]PMH95203.1 ABC transporter substrate-binding protein [Shewanella sp. 10N.286.48.A6]
MFKKLLAMTSSTQMLVAMFVGFAVGIFFGESVGWLSAIGNGVILLMQMTVLPYIVVSLIGGIGKLQKSTAILIFSRAGAIMLLLWLVGLVLTALMPLSFPFIESASFFSTSIIEPAQPINYFKLYIPSNPFESMAEGYVPAMVVFSIALGLALISMEGDNKKLVLTFMHTITEAFSRITQGLVKVLPIGIFAMSASAAGTMGVDEFASMQVYLISYFALCLLLTFAVLPWIVSSLTPITYRQTVNISKASLVTAFATGNIFIVIPVIIAECKQIMREHNNLTEDGVTLIEILVPIAFTFPNIGKLTVILFVYFAGWFNGTPVDISAMPSLSVSGLLSLFGSVYVAIPFMLDLVQLPSDLFQLFVMSGFITGKFNSIAAVMNLFALTLLTVCLFQGTLKIRPPQLIKMSVGLLASTAVTIVVCRIGMGLFIHSPDITSEVIANMKVADKVPTKVTRQYPEIGKTPTQAIASVHSIRQRGLLRVGYIPSNVPFSYYNNAGQLVGFDIAMATKLAEDLKVEVEFIPFKKDKLAASLQAGFFDVAMSGLSMDIKQMDRLSYGEPVLELNIAIATQDHRVNSFKTDESILEMENTTIAYVEHDDKIADAKKKLPHINFVKIDGYKDFFRQKAPKYDAVVISAEAGSAWTLFFPGYGIAILEGKNRYPVAYAVAQPNQSLLNYINNWQKLRRVDGHQQQFYDYWMLGKGATTPVPRWSIIRDVLHWVD